MTRNLSRWTTGPSFNTSPKLRFSKKLVELLFDRMRERSWDMWRGKLSTTFVTCSAHRRFMWDLYNVSQSGCWATGSVLCRQEIGIWDGIRSWPKGRSLCHSIDVDRGMRGMFMVNAAYSHRSQEQCATENSLRVPRVRLRHAMILQTTNHCLLQQGRVRQGNKKGILFPCGCHS